MTWKVRTLDHRVDKEIKALPVQVRASFFRVVDLLIEHGPENVGMPYVRYLDSGLWEIRAKGKEGIGRGIYVKAKGREIVVVHAFVKKTQKTPRAALSLARKRAKDV
jgi:phage-related protein